MAYGKYESDGRMVIPLSLNSDTLMKLVPFCRERKFIIDDFVSTAIETEMEKVKEREQND